MGRAKQKIEFIANKKARASMLKRRKQGLINKLQQLVTLCDVDACLVIHVPDAPDDHAIWPPGETRRMIDLYNSGTRSIKTYGVSDFCLDPKKTQDFNGEKNLCTQGQSSSPPPMSMSPYFDIPMFSSMDPHWMGTAVVESQDSSEDTQFFTPPNLHQMTSSPDLDLNLDDIIWTFGDFV